MILLEFFNKKPASIEDWKEKSIQLEVTLAFLSKHITAAVRDGVILGGSKLINGK